MNRKKLVIGVILILVSAGLLGMGLRNWTRRKSRLEHGDRLWRHDTKPQFWRRDPLQIRSLAKEREDLPQRQRQGHRGL